ncbi:hypothetical protein OIHEL45_09953 [Sulfitobacter indolifex HEL-45]|uniref:DNA-directed DNA polymerase family A palm domain-containing protein n=1 Tax=Sulfitobacter indolifex HEL-45 TaxID=391624 RepID=A0ABM9X6F5_9RHOB|nr:hypothetical protein [Sulfitobacter indolifex]EDQ05056.1 hypothetical protein OIHEL45_09953 [Sulfitobacter indolifex HEL-45]
MSDLLDQIPQDQLDALAITVGAVPSAMPSGDVRDNFRLFHKIEGSKPYRKKLAQAARDLYEILRQNKTVQNYVGKRVYLKGRERGRIKSLPRTSARYHCSALELLLHSIAFALSAPLTKDSKGSKRREFVAIPLANNAFSKPPYKGINRDAFRSVVYALAIFDPEKQGKPWLDYRPPFNNPETGEGKRTCIRADTPLEEWMFSKGLIFPYHPSGPDGSKSKAGKRAKKSCLWVSCKAQEWGEETQYSQLDRPLEGEEMVLLAINEVLNKQRISCQFTSYAEYKKYYNYREGRPRTALGGNKRLCRVFSEEDGRGGRLYGHWVQTMPSELRQRLRIDGSVVSELDFGSMQLALLYHLADAPVPEGDLYSQPGMTSSRSDMKMVLTLSVGNATEQETLGAIRGRLHDEWRPRKGRAEQLYDEFWSYHSLANPHQQSESDGAWIELQRLDSAIALRILARLLDDGITAIPVHDSFIVKRCHVETTKDVMLQVFAEYCPGTDVQVKVTGKGA